MPIMLAPLILLVDDDPNFREIFPAKFASLGFRVETASNGEEGIAKAKALQPDLMVLDMQMPGLSGMDVLMRLRESPETKTMKVAFLTNLGDPKPESRQMNDRVSREVGALGYIKKTDDLDSIADRIKSFL